MPTHEDPNAEYTMTVPEAAEALEITPGYVRRMIADGRLQSIKRAGARFVRPADVEALRERPDRRRREDLSPTNVRPVLDVTNLEEMQELADSHSWMTALSGASSVLSAKGLSEDFHHAIASLYPLPLTGLQEAARLLAESAVPKMDWLPDGYLSSRFFESYVSFLPTSEDLRSLYDVASLISINASSLRDFLGTDSALAALISVAVNQDVFDEELDLDSLHEAADEILTEQRREAEARADNVQSVRVLSTLDYTGPAEGGTTVINAQVVYLIQGDGYIVQNQAMGHGDIEPLLTAIEALQRELQEIVSLQKRNNDDTREMLELLESLVVLAPMQRKTGLRRLADAIAERAAAAGFDAAAAQITTERIAMILTMIEKLPG